MACWHICYPGVDKLPECVHILTITTKYDYESLLLSYNCHLEGQKGLCSSLSINWITNRMVKMRSVGLPYFIW